VIEDLDLDALAYYDAVLERLAARGITPMVTLNHLTLPRWVLFPPITGGLLRGDHADARFQASLRGWENTATVDALVEFTAFVVARWMDRVKWWVTLNEPVGSMIGVGYLAGIWPPGFAPGRSCARASVAVHAGLLRRVAPARGTGAHPV
jgi:beta-glucosidase